MTKVLLRDRSGIEDYKRALKISDNPLIFDALRCALELGEDYWVESCS